MSVAEEYLERVVLAAEAATEEPILSKLTERCGLVDDDIKALVLKIAPARAALGCMDEAAAELNRTSILLKTNLAAVKTDLTALRHMVTDNFDRGDPVMKALGLNTETPQSQEELLGFAQTVFTNGQQLDPLVHPLLAKRKWDTPRFTTALAHLAAARAANTQQEAAKGKSLAATSAFYDAVDELDKLFRPFAKNARSNLADLPGALESMKLQDALPPKPKRPLPGSDRKKPAVKPAAG